MATPGGSWATLISALRTVAPALGEDILGRLQGHDPPPTDLVLTDLVNELAQARQDLTVVLDDYHLERAWCEYPTGVRRLDWFDGSFVTGMQAAADRAIALGDEELRRSSCDWVAPALAETAQ